MKGFGYRTKHMEKVDLYMQMEIYMKGNGWLIKHMDLVCILIVMGLGMKGNGEQIIRKVMEWKHGLMAVSMKGSI